MGLVIASEGPRQSTTHDFWTVVVIERVKLIVTLARSIGTGGYYGSDCARYFPTEAGSSEIYGDISVKCTSLKKGPAVHVRELVVDNEHIVKHVHFTEWHDFETPSDRDLTTYCTII